MEAAGLESRYQKYLDQDVMFMFAWSENDNGETPTKDELKTLADYYGMTMPNIADPGSSVYWRWGQGALPDGALLGPGGVVLATGVIQDSQIDAALADM